MPLSLFIFVQQSFSISPPYTISCPDYRPVTRLGLTQASSWDWAISSLELWVVASVKVLTSSLWRGLVLFLWSDIDRTEGWWLCREHGTGTDWQTLRLAVLLSNFVRITNLNWLSSQSQLMLQVQTPPAEPWKEGWRETDSTSLLFKLISPRGNRSLSNTAKAITICLVISSMPFCSWKVSKVLKT